MEEHYSKISESNENNLVNQSNTKNAAKEIARPGIPPKNTYTTKAPKK